MRLTALELASLVEGKLSGDPGQVLTGAAGLDEAGKSDISFIGNPRYLDQLASTGAGLVLIPEKAPETPRPVIRVTNPQKAFAMVLSIIEKDLRKDLSPGIHPSAVVSAAATVGRDTIIGPFAVIEENAIIGDRTHIAAHSFVGRNSRVGDDCLIYPTVTLREGVSVGNKVIIHSGAVIGSDGFGFVPGEKGHFKIPQIGGVEIGDDVEIGANAAIDRATTGQTRIGRGTKIDNLVHIAHNVRIGDHCLITGQVGFAGSCHVGNFVTFGAQSGAGGHLTIGDNATIAARGGVTRDVAPKDIVSGFPARPHREQMKIQAIIQKLPELYESVRELIKRSKK